MTLPIQSYTYAVGTWNNAVEEVACTNLVSIISII